MKRIIAVMAVGFLFGQTVQGQEKALTNKLNLRPTDPSFKLAMNMAKSAQPIRESGKRGEISKQPNEIDSSVVKKTNSLPDKVVPTKTVFSQDFFWKGLGRPELLPVFNYPVFDRHRDSFGHQRGVKVFEWKF